MQLKAKLNSNSGASMMLALALMLVCVFVSSVILTAATSGATRNEKRNAQQREYLAISSAAQMLQENLKDAGTLAGQTTIKAYQCNVYLQMGQKTITIQPPNAVAKSYTGYPISWDISAGYPDKLLMVNERNASGGIPDGAEEQNYFCKNVRNLEVNLEKTKFNGPFAELMERAAYAVFDTERAYKESFFVYVGESEQIEAERLPKVKCDFTMNAAYEVMIVLFVEDGVSDYKMQINMGVEKETEGYINVTAECEHPIVSFTINEDTELMEAHEEVQVFRRNNACPAIVITWLEPQISKEGVQ